MKTVTTIENEEKVESYPVWKSKVSSAKEVMFKLNKAKYTTQTMMKIIMDIFFKSKAAPKQNVFEFKDNLDIQTFRKLSHYHKKKLSLNTWDIEKLMHLNMPFVTEDNKVHRLHYEKASRQGFWFKFDFNQGEQIMSKSNVTMQYELIKGFRTLCFYGG